MSARRFYRPNLGQLTSGPPARGWIIRWPLLASLALAADVPAHAAPADAAPAARGADPAAAAPSPSRAGAVPTPALANSPTNSSSHGAAAPTPALVSQPGRPGRAIPPPLPPNSCPGEYA